MVQTPGLTRRRGCPAWTPCGEAPPSPLRKASSAGSGSFPGFPDSRQSPHPCPLPKRPEVRPRPSPVVSGFVGTMGLSDFRRGYRPLPVRGSRPLSRGGSPTLIQRPSLRAVPRTPAGRARVRLGSPWPAWPSPQNGRVGTRDSSFEASSGFASRYGPQLRLPTPGGRYPRPRGAGCPVQVSALGLLPGCPISSPGETLTHVYA